jgi:hypothetical protein
LAAYPVDLAIPCVLVWALAGVYLNLNEPPEQILQTFTTEQIQYIQYTVVGAMGVIGAGTVLKSLYVLLCQRPAAMRAASKNNDATSGYADEENPKRQAGNDEEASA